MMDVRFRRSQSGAGFSSNITMAQEALHHRVQCNSAAIESKYCAQTEGANDLKHRMEQKPAQLSIRCSWIYSQSTAFDFWQWMQRMSGERFLEARNRGNGN
jgi:hypothetical protein